MNRKLCGNVRLLHSNRKFCKMLGISQGLSGTRQDFRTSPLAYKGIWNMFAEPLKTHQSIHGVAHNSYKHQVFNII
jgi:hypothetical protein